MDRASDVYAVIVAGGTGSRFGSDRPKQFLALGDRWVLTRSVELFLKMLPAYRIVVVLHPDWINQWKEECESHGIDGVEVALGGDTRWQSVKNGLMALSGVRPDDIVLVHDGARPLVTEGIVGNVIEALRAGSDGAIPVVPVVDSVRKKNDDGSSVALDRSSLHAVQTPQGFKLGKLCRAFELPYSPLFTDEASMMETAGFTDIALVDGDPLNFKITRRSDLALAEIMIDCDNGGAKGE